MTPTISVAGLTRRYRGHVALDDVTVDIEGPRSPGCSAATAWARRRSCASSPPRSFPRRAASGSSAPARPRTTRSCAGWCSSARTRPSPTSRSARSSGWRRGSTRTGAPSWPRRCWPTSACPLNRKVKKLSRGMRSAVGIIIGLAARAEVTLFDEPYAGLDAVARQVFYDRLLADYAEHPRTVAAVHPPDRRGRRPAGAGGGDGPRAGRARRARRRHPRQCRDRERPGRGGGRVHRGPRDLGPPHDRPGRSLGRRGRGDGRARPAAGPASCGSA